MPASSDLPEVWLRGPLPSIPQLLQPVAHALLQAREEIEKLLSDFPEEMLWARPAGLASAGFHLRHLSGVLDRLFTYARGESLSEDQLVALGQEGDCNQASSVKDLQKRFNRQVDLSLEELSKIREHTLTEKRGVGRAQMPSTVIGLLVHAAEHTMRHVGQLLVTIRVLQH
jgi:uncharacterized damage-inducible protein DinB